jgi:hypothetical protein
MKRKAKITIGTRLLGILLLELLPGSSAYSQTIPMQGDTFWTVFGTYAGYNPRFCICSQEQSSGTIYLFKDNTSISFEVDKDTCIFVNIPYTSVNGGATLTISPLAVLVTASKPVTLYKVNAHENILTPMHSNNVWPAPVQGIEYLINSFTGDFKFTYLFVVSRSDSTHVEITPSVTVSGLPLPPGTPFSIWMNRGQVYQMGTNSGSGDLTGTRVRSLPAGGGAPLLSVYSLRVGLSSNNIYVKRSNPSSMELPIEKWGNRYHSVPHLSRKGDVLRILAAYDSTVVNINGIPSFTLNTGNFVDTLLIGTASLVSTRPISVQMISLDTPADSVVNSSCFRYPLLPDESRVTRAVFTSDRFLDSTGVISNQYMSLVCKTAYTGMVRLDGVSIASQFVSYPADPQWSYAQMPVTKGLHILEADSGVLGYYYAYGYASGYGHVIAGGNNVLTGVAQVPDKTSTIMVYPNPMSSTLWVQAAGAEPGYTRITVTGIHGREEYRHEAIFGSTNWQHEINTGHLARGMYFIRVQSGSSVKVLKVVKM